MDEQRLAELVKTIGKDRLVLDLSCRKRGGDYFVVTDRWQKFTDLKITRETLETLADSCAEFLVHAVDVEGLCRGVDDELVSKAGRLVADSDDIRRRRQFAGRSGKSHAAGAGERST